MRRGDASDAPTVISRDARTRRETNGTGAMDDAGGRSRDEINCGDAWISAIGGQSSRRARVKTNGRLTTKTRRAARDGDAQRESDNDDAREREEERRRARLERCDAW